MAAAAARQSDTRRRQLRSFIEASLPPHINAKVAVRLTPAIDTACIIPCDGPALEERSIDESGQQLADSLTDLDADYLVVVTSQPAPVEDLPSTSQLAADRYLQFGYALHELLHALKTDSGTIATLLEDRVDQEHHDRVHELWNIAEDGAIENEAITGSAFGEAASDRLYILNVALSQTRDALGTDRVITLTWWDAVTTALYEYCVYSPPQKQSLLYALLDPTDDAVEFESPADREAFFDVDPALRQLATDTLLLRSTPRDAVVATHDLSVSVTRAKRVLQTWEQALRPHIDEPAESDQTARPEDSGVDSGESGAEASDRQGTSSETEPQGQEGATAEDATSGGEQPPSADAAPDDSSSQSSQSPSAESTTPTPSTGDALETPSLDPTPDSDPADSPSPDDLLPDDGAADDPDNEPAETEDGEQSSPSDSAESRSDSGSDAPTDRESPGQDPANSQQNEQTSPDEASDPRADTDTQETPTDEEDTKNQSRDKQGQITLDSFVEEGNDTDDSRDGDETNSSASDASPADEEEASGGTGTEDQSETDSEADTTPASPGQTTPDEGGDEASEEPPDTESPDAEAKIESSDDTDSRESQSSAPSQSSSPSPSPALSEDDQQATPETESVEEAKAQAEADTLDIDTQAIEDELSGLAEQMDDSTGTDADQAPASQSSSAGDGTLDSLTVLPELDTGSTDDTEGWDDIETESKRVADRLRKALQLNQQSSVRSGQTSGSYNASDGYKLSYGDPSVFERSTPGDQKRYSMVLIGDGSGSMRHGTPSKISVMRTALGQFALAAEGLGIDVAIIDFINGEARLVKPFSVPVPAVRDVFTDQETGGGTPLSDALELGLSLAESQRWQSLIVTMTDGKPSDVDDCKSLITSSMTPVCSLTIATDCQRGNPPERAEELDTAFDQSRTVFEADNLSTELDRLASLLGAY